MNVGKLRRKLKLAPKLANDCAQHRILIPGINTNETARNAQSRGFKVSWLDAPKACKHAKTVLLLYRYHKKLRDFLLIKIFRG